MCLVDASILHFDVVHQKSILTPSIRPMRPPQLVCNTVNKLLWEYLFATRICIIPTFGSTESMVVERAKLQWGGATPIVIWSNMFWSVEAVLGISGWHPKWRLFCSIWVIRKPRVRKIAPKDVLLYLSPLENYPIDADQRRSRRRKFIFFLANFSFFFGSPSNEWTLCQIRPIVLFSMVCFWWLRSIYSPQR